MLVRLQRDMQRGKERGSSTIPGTEETLVVFTERNARGPTTNQEAVPVSGKVSTVERQFRELARCVDTDGVLATTSSETT